jgi:DNA-binding transcriptional LysR family regulator
MEMLPQIEAFLEVARRQNLSRAAEALFVSQPTLTARLQSLEAALGEQLFIRTRRGMRLTEAGDAFLPYAEHALAALADGRERLAELRRGVAGRLVLGAPPTVSTYTLPALLARFSAAHPGVRLTVKTGTSEEILDMVLHDQVQLGIIRALASQEIETIPLYTDTLVLIAGPGHRLARSPAGRQARMADLAGEVLILFGRSSSYLEFTTATFRQAGVLPGSVLELDNIEAAKKMVERGLGV